MYIFIYVLYICIYIYVYIYVYIYMHINTSRYNKHVAPPNHGLYDFQGRLVPDEKLEKLHEAERQQGRPDDMWVCLKIGHARSHQIIGNIMIIE